MKESIVIQVKSGSKKLRDFIACRLDQIERNIMSAISDYAAQVKEHHDSISAAVDSIVTSVNGLSGDIQRLKKTIDDLQNSPGGITPEDQALLDSAVQQASAAASKVKSVADAVKALDDETAEPPTVQPTPP